MKKPSKIGSPESKMANDILESLSEEDKDKMIEMVLSDKSTDGINNRLGILFALGYREHEFIVTRGADGKKFKLKATVEEIE